MSGKRLEVDREKARVALDSMSVIRLAWSDMRRREATHFKEHIA